MKSDKLMSTGEFMKLTQDGYEAFRSKQAADTVRSGKGQLVAANKTIEGPSTFYFRNVHNQDILEYASCKFLSQVLVSCEAELVIKFCY